MAVFISYSHKDKDFAHTLAANLIRHKTSIWIDEWEINAGDSMITKIQDAIQKASALIIVFSKDSIESIWCQKEVIAGIQRELEEKKVLVIPVKIDDCQLPLFVRDKMYADFRTDPNEGLSKILTAVAKYSNPTMGRIEGDEYETDWSYSYGDAVAKGLDNGYFIEFIIVKFSKSLDYSVVTTVRIIANPEATKRFKVWEKAGFREFGHLTIIESFLEHLEDNLPLLLEDNMPIELERTIYDPKLNYRYDAYVNCRRLGNDNGRDVLIHGREEIELIRDMVRSIVKPPSAEEMQQIFKIVASR